jgi:hypothetical protein
MPLFDENGREIERDPLSESIIALKAEREQQKAEQAALLETLKQWATQIVKEQQEAEFEERVTLVYDLLREEAAERFKNDIDREGLVGGLKKRTGKWDLLRKRRARAKALRAQGLTFREIAQMMGLKDPSRARYCCVSSDKFYKTNSVEEQRQKWRESQQRHRQAVADQQPLKTTGGQP